MTTKIRKESYTVPCSSLFRDAVTALATRQKVNIADLARSVLLLVPEDTIRTISDPGGPPPGDREETILKSGPSKGRPWRRKPRLQVRLSPGHDISVVRRALNLALILDDGKRAIEIHGPLERKEAEKENSQVSAELLEDLERLRAIVSVLSFDPLREGVTSKAEALHVLGFAPTERPDREAVRARFRMMATIHHPDSNYGNHQRMSQLNAAMDFLNG